MNAPLLGLETILIVDDEPANLKLLDRMLRSQGYRSLELVQDPREVLARYRAHRPDLILLDINMPWLDGYQVMAQLRALHDPLLPPIVVLTAQHGRERLLRALAAGARDYITKPFDRNELLMRVRNLRDAHLSHRCCTNKTAFSRSWCAPSAGARSSATCCSTPAPCTTSARSASPTPSCSSRANSTLKNGPS